jgi:hypothetical protein
MLNAKSQRRKGNKKNLAAERLRVKALLKSFIAVHLCSSPVTKSIPNGDENIVLHEMCF